MRPRNYRILIVEDDAAVLDACCRILQPEGMSVRTAKNVDDALGFIHVEQFDLVLTDLKMPGPDGHALAAVIKRIRPALPVLAMTGYLPEVTAGRMENFSAGFLPKPFTPDELLSVILRALGEELGEHKP